MTPGIINQYITCIGALGLISYNIHAQNTYTYTHTKTHTYTHIKTHTHIHKKIPTHTQKKHGGEWIVVGVRSDEN